MTGNFQVSKKMNDGTIIVIGGDTVEEFAGNLAGIVGNEGRDAIRALFYDLVPISAPAAPQSSPGFSQVQQAFPGSQPVGPPPNDWQGQPQSSAPQEQLQAYRQQPAGPPPGQSSGPLCPNHNQPAKWVPPGVSSRTNKPYQGFWSCPQEDRTCKPR